MKIYINGVLLNSRIKEKNIYVYILSDGSKLKTKEIKTFDVVCDECGKNTKLKIYPTGKSDKYLCGTCRQLGDKNPMFGKKWTDEQKQIRSELYKGENNPMYGKSNYDIWVKKYGKDEADVKMKLFLNKMSDVTSGENNPMFGKSFYDVWLEKYGEEEANKKLLELKNNHSEWLLNNKEHHHKMIINSHKKTYRKTSIEKELETFLIENDINYKYNYINKYQYDFLLFDYNLIIEAQGDYWHGNPNIYSDTDINLKPLNEQQRYKKQLDIDKYEYIKDTYDIIHIWETEIKNKKYKEILWNLLKLKK